ncbi:cyanoexosortase A [Gloeocapsa sp. PCC 73106]|uniref:cyanoexosortase A n=1 Tax=Gloeocapsa sp. PCC 73106 TaxID=102232 RepID=UPI0002AC1CDA|nr:cyanoexosortase A [Gloeocapsa sp. PCC 73106]ELS00169.1 exosortase, cyanobacterial variant [Gloeocapsa sp. PCC 73106]
MKIASNLPEDIFQKPYFWILLIASALFAIYFTLLWRADDVAHMGMSALFLLAAGSLIWERKETLIFKTTPLAIATAVVIIGLTLYGLSLNLDLMSTYAIDFHVVLRAAPFLFALSLALIAGGFTGLRSYWRELIIIFALGVPSIFLTPINLSPLTAKFASVFLWAMGFNLGVDGIRLYLPNSIVIVARNCSGMESITYVLGISVLYLIMFPLKKIHNFIVPIIAVLIGFSINLVRVLAMAVLIDLGKKEAFHYWHEGEGSLIVGLVAVLVFSIFYFTLVKIVVGEEVEEQLE